MSEMQRALSVLAGISGLHLCNTASAWFFAGSIPGVLAYVTKDGGKPTEEQLANAQSFGPRVSGLKRRFWDSQWEALEAAAELGYPVE